MRKGKTTKSNHPDPKGAFAMDIYDKVKSVVTCVWFFVAIIATLICPFSDGMTIGLVGKLWLTYFGIQAAWAILDGSMAEIVCIMSSLFRRR